MTSPPSPLKESAAGQDAEVVVKLPAWLIDEMLDASSDCNNLPPLRLFILAARMGLFQLRDLFQRAKKEKLAREKDGEK